MTGRALRAGGAVPALSTRRLASTAYGRVTPVVRADACSEVGVCSSAENGHSIGAIHDPDLSRTGRSGPCPDSTPESARVYVDQLAAQNARQVDGEL
jgi:hypothetical protein